MLVWNCAQYTSRLREYLLELFGNSFITTTSYFVPIKTNNCSLLKTILGTRVHAASIMGHKATTD
jgi:hypothetical protein